MYVCMIMHEMQVSDQKMQEMKATYEKEQIIVKKIAIRQFFPVYLENYFFWCLFKENMHLYLWSQVKPDRRETCFGILHTMAIQPFLI